MIELGRRFASDWQQQQHQQPPNSLPIIKMRRSIAIQRQELPIHNSCRAASGQAIVLGQQACHRFGVSAKRTLSTKTAATDHRGGETSSNPTHRLKLYNTMTNSLEPLPFVDSSTEVSMDSTTSATTTTTTTTATTAPKLGLGWYTCGPTTYAPAHLGHARTYVCLDILRRVMTSKRNSATTPTTPGPLFVLNITDVDDKTLQAAIEDGGSDPLLLARRYEREFWRDWDDLNCLRPHVVTRVTEHVDSHIVPFVEGLVKKGFAYELVEGDSGDGAADGVYFDVRAYNERMGHLTRYGKLAPPAAARDMDDILLHNKENKVDESNNSLISEPYDPSIPSRKKRDSRDFVLWKKREKGQEALSWSSPWGDGRPGWHIECSAMIEAVQERFRDSHRFLVHAGGIDLKFPHHTNEIAQSEAYLGVGEWIPHWVHTGHLHIDGLKMSKSLKNFVSIEDFMAGRIASSEEDETSMAPQNTRSALESPSDDFRLWCLGLSGSYRGPATFSMTRIGEARSIRYKFLRFLTEGEDWLRSKEAEGVVIFPSKKWDDDECDLIRTTDAAKRRGLSALENDLDGSAFVSELLAIADCGMKYMATEERGPVEPLVHAIGEVRELLRLVGFTKITTEAGIQAENSEKQSGRVCEESLVESLVRFRSRVREIGLEDPSAPGLKELLTLSDELRDSVLPEIGVQLIDSNNNSDETKSSTAWKFCLPRRPSTKNISPTKTDAITDASMDLLSVPILDFFKVGQYEGMFSEYTKDGTPTHNSDGSEVSKRFLKKLLKKRDKHLSRLEKNN